MTAVRVVEVGVRDGLQAVRKVIPARLKIQLVEKLRDAGLKEIELTSFVSPKWVPQMGDQQELCQAFEGREGRLMALVPNRKGFEGFQNSTLRRVAFFTAFSDTFNQKNVNRSFEEHVPELRELMESARSEGLWIRLYVSTITHCPYDGVLKPEVVLKRLERLLDLPFDDISLGETTGRAVPSQIRSLARGVSALLPKQKVSWHFHDTYGMGMANVSEALNLGFLSFDSSISGLGGCPFAPGAAGNVATEDLVYFLHQSGLQTGICLSSLLSAPDSVNLFLKREARPRSVQALRRTV